MLRALQLAVAPFIGLLAATLAGETAYAAPIVIDSGSFAGGDIERVSGTLSLAPGLYLFSLSVKGNIDSLVSYTESHFSEDFYCDAHDGKGFYPCAGDDNYDETDFDEVKPGIFEGRNTALPSISKILPGQPFGEGVTVLYKSSLKCCVYRVEFNAIMAGSYQLSYRALPEPVTWALMIVGFAGIGAALRRPRTAIAFG